MIVKNMDDLRDALDRMAKYNRVSLSALNDLARVGAGILTRMRRNDVKTRSTRDDEVRLIKADMKLSTLLTVVDAAGWEMVLQPKDRPNRRTRVLDAAREENQGEVNNSDVT